MANKTISQHLDSKLIEEAMELGGHTSLEAAVTAALQEYVNRKKKLRLPDHDYKAERQQREKRLQLLELLKSGTIQWDPHYDYKALR